MEWWNSSVVALVGIAIKGFKWRCQPAGVYCAHLAFRQENSPAVNSITAAPPWTSA
jgi:hypothetical protein